MVLPVEFKQPSMYSTQPEMRTEVEELAREHHQKFLLGRDGKIYDKVIVTCNFHTSSFSGDPREHCTAEYHAGSFVKTQHLYRKNETKSKDDLQVSSLAIQAYVWYGSTNAWNHK
ncbi:MAG: hypothetical protein M4579_007036 [Chaenotheca gracillima]|nr:MAG: hypothetical protein M4579_007036 [Chaenotheca gracillima]